MSSAADGPASTPREPVVAAPGERIAATGASFAMHEWSHGPGGGPPLHIHHHDDEAWHILEGRLRFRLAGRTFDADAGTSVFVPAGVAHTFNNPGPGAVRYLIIMTGQIMQLIEALHAEGRADADDAAVYRRYGAALVE